jgi:Putative Actinobacterial Holin-X, holin superfamily III
MAIAKFPRSITDIFVDVVNQFTILVRWEAQLARAEILEKLTDLGIGAGLLAGGSVLLIPALVILLQAAVAALIAANIATAWASLIVGGATLAIGVVLLALGNHPTKSGSPGAYRDNRAATTRC